MPSTEDRPAARLSAGTDTARDFLGSGEFCWKLANLGLGQESCPCRRRGCERPAALQALLLSIMGGLLQALTQSVAERFEVRGRLQTQQSQRGHSTVALDTRSVTQVSPPFSFSNDQGSSWLSNLFLLLGPLRTSMFRCVAGGC